ncbi:PCYCGC motif-containing (lipo)protein [Paenibacillus cellulositrophicus]|uniref:Outer membrane murein-binding lipoprotein Lpp n=2 Tax=Paenibacillus TaxID=44249 RepID=A0ABV2F3W9_9BACL
MMMGSKARLSVLGIVLGGLLVSGCSDKGGPDSAEQTMQHDHGAHQQMAANGDLQETTGGKEQLPSFLQPANDTVRTAYMAAAGVKEVLNQIPCYCGCGESAGHKSNLNCFIKEVNPDGSVVWDDHGTRCGVCVETALTAASLVKEGKSVKEIRGIIDQTYSNGKYAAPTPTPEV